MKLRVLAPIIVCIPFVPQTIGQEDQKHFAFHTPSAATSFVADSIQRQDPVSTSQRFASVVQLRGNVQIRTCCIQAPDWSKKRSPNPPRQVVMMRADEVDFNQETGEMEVRGNVRVSLQNYPNQTGTNPAPHKRP